MYSSLRPEIRAAQRVLRSIHHSQSKSTHHTVRSFSSYLRLQSQPGNSGSQNKPETSKDGKSPLPILDQIQELIRSVTGINQPVPHNFKSTEPISQTESESPDINDTEKREEEEKKEIDEALSKGEIPEGYRIIYSQNDLPRDLKDLAESGRGPDLPFLLSEGPSKLSRVYPLPKEFEKLQETKMQSVDFEELTGKQEVDSEQSTQSISSEPSPNTFYGSSNARRKRPRPTKSAPVLKEQIPSWLLENNLKLTRLHRMDADVRPGVWSTSNVKAGYERADETMGSHTYKSAVKEIDAATAQKFPQVGGPTPLIDPAPFTLDATGGSSANQSDTRNEKSNVGPLLELSSARIRQAKSALPRSRYFIDSTQRKEVLHTFNGRLKYNSGPATNSHPGRSAANHIAIYHTGKDADFLLYQLVEDLCQSQGADLLRLDAQDISALIAQADVFPEVSSRGNRASFSIFKNVYSSSAAFFDAVMPADDFEDNMDEDEDDHNARGSVDIPVASFVALPGSSMPTRFLDGIRKKVFGSGGPLSGFLDSRPAESDSRYGMFSAMIDSLLSSAKVRVRREYSRYSAEATSEDGNMSNNKSIDDRPLVIHVPDVQAIQDHSLTSIFLTELLQAADSSTKRGQYVMVVGTDTVRDLELQAGAQRIIDRQETRPIPSVTAIVLTPSYPPLSSRHVFSEDRKRRIATINARHLWSVLHHGRGIQLKGLEAGFWTRDLLKDIGEKDYEILAHAYLPYSKVQRIASILSADSFHKSETPVYDAIHLIESSDETKLTYLKRNRPPPLKADIKTEESPEDKRLSQIRATATKYEKKLLGGVIEPSKISTTFKDIHIPFETIEALQTLTTLSLVRPDAFRYGVLKSDRIPGLMLYGPPGTGKTLAAKAVAKESGATMLEVSAANLNDMYVGESEKNVQALFSLAKKLSPCVVFLDEADAMFSARQNHGRRISHREVLNQFLREWDGMSNDSGSAFLMVATNRPMDLDDAVLRRLPRRILIDLPTEQDRLEILNIHLRQEGLADDVNIADLAKKTPFYSGSDLKNVAVAAALNAVRDEQSAAKKYAQENPDGPAYQYPEKRTLTSAHFETALEEISASISEDMTTLKDIRKFDEQYGDKRGKRKKTSKWGFRNSTDVDEKKDTVKVRA